MNFCVIFHYHIFALQRGYSDAAFFLLACVSVSLCVIVCLTPSPCDTTQIKRLLFVPLRQTNHDKRINRIDLGGVKSKVKVTMDNY